MNHLRVRFYYPRDGAIYADPRNTSEVVPNFLYLGIPQGTHRLVALYYSLGIPPDSVWTTQDVPVYPGIGARDIRLRFPFGWDDPH